jgi:hypothetical protein
MITNWHYLVPMMWAAIAINIGTALWLVRKSRKVTAEWRAVTQKWHEVNEFLAGVKRDTSHAKSRDEWRQN